MASGTEVEKKLQTALDEERWADVEEQWLEALDSDPIPVATLLEVRRQLYDVGRKTLALTLLDLLVEALEARGGPQATLAALRELVRLKKSTSDEELKRLSATLAKARAASPSLERVMTRFPLVGVRRPLEVLETAERWLDHDIGTVVEVAGQGVGRVVDVNLELDTVKVDIGKARPVSVPFGAIGRYIRLLPEGDFLRRKVEEPEVLKKWVEDEPGAALVDLLASLGTPADVAAIKHALGDLLPAERWTTWWGKARKHPRVVSSGAGSRLRYGVGASADEATDSLLQTLAAAGLAQRPALTRRLAARGAAGAEAAARLLADSLAELETSNPGLAWETAAVLATLPGGEVPAAACQRRLVTTDSPMVLLAGIGDRTVRGDALTALRAAHGERWPRIWAQWLVREDTPGLLSSISQALVAAGASEALSQAVDTVMRSHNDYPAQFVWAAETMTEPDCPEAIARHLGPSLLEKIPDALTRPEYSSLRGRAKGLLDGGKAAIRVILEQATPQQAERFAQRVARLDVVELQRAKLVAQAANQRQGGAPRDTRPLLVATRRAIAAKQAELKQLVEVEIPKTLKGINAAAAEGDLRENFEYHMLRDRQELQSAKAAKIQAELGAVRTLEPGAADTSRVNIGTVIHLADLAGAALLPVTILGPWDADIDRRIFANGTDLAEGLLGRTVGSEVTVEGRAARITAIVAWRDDD